MKRTPFMMLFKNKCLYERGTDNIMTARGNRSGMGKHYAKQVKSGINTTNCRGKKPGADFNDDKALNF